MTQAIRDIVMPTSLNFRVKALITTVAAMKARKQLLAESGIQAIPVSEISFQLLYTDGRSYSFKVTRTSGNGVNVIVKRQARPARIQNTKTRSTLDLDVNLNPLIRCAVTRFYASLRESLNNNCQTDSSAETRFTVRLTKRERSSSGIYIFTRRAS